MCTDLLPPCLVSRNWMMKGQVDELWQKINAERAEADALRVVESERRVQFGKILDGLKVQLDCLPPPNMFVTHALTGTLHHPSRSSASPALVQGGYRKGDGRTG